MSRENDNDPRISIINKRLEKINRIIVVLSGKGGVGKSLIATMSSLILSKNGKNVGLLDLDFQNPSCHTILGFFNGKPIENKGVIPPITHGIKFMSIVYYSKEKPIPLRGGEITDTIIEIFTIVRWNSLDYLFIDMPPGIGDEVLDIIKLVKNCEVLIITTPSKLAIETFKKVIEMLKISNVKILGVIENMKKRKEKSVVTLAKKYKVKYLGHIPFDYKIEKNLSNPLKLLKTNFSKKLEKILEKL
ncbi:MAG: Mrp/NBP35 family ATP-binding protein [Candidatus Aenigmatarchaeota archaeon]